MKNWESLHKEFEKILIVRPSQLSLRWEGSASNLMEIIAMSKEKREDALGDLDTVDTLLEVYPRNKMFPADAWLGVYPYGKDDSNALVLTSNRYYELEEIAEGRNRDCSDFENDDCVVIPFLKDRHELEERILFEAAKLINKILIGFYSEIYKQELSNKE